MTLNDSLKGHMYKTWKPDFSLKFIYYYVIRVRKTCFQYSSQDNRFKVDIDQNTKCY